MNLNLPDPPNESISELGSTLTALAARGQFGTRVLRNARPEQLSVTAPHEICTMGLDALRQRPEQIDAQPTAWRYMLEIDERVVASAETAMRPNGSHEFSHLNEGPFVMGTVRALSVAEAIGDSQDCQVRVLSVPALYFMSLWLSPANATSSEADVLIPIAPTPQGIEANRSYTASELLGILSERAQSIPEIGQDDDIGG